MFKIWILTKKRSSACSKDLSIHPESRFSLINVMTFFYSIGDNDDMMIDNEWSFLQFI